MKFTNVKQLIIKFMGGGLINFPTRFLRWVKINGDTDDSDGGSDDGGGGGGEEGNSNIFFSPLAIQPSYYGIGNDVDNNITIHEIQDVANTISYTYSEPTSLILLYSKEQVINLGINENILNNLQQVTFPELIEDITGDHTKCYIDSENNNIVSNNYIINQTIIADDSITFMRIEGGTGEIIALYKFGDDIYLFTAISIG